MSRRRLGRPLRRGYPKLGVALAAMGGGGSLVIILAARYVIGGAELHGDIGAGVAHLPRNSDSHYVDGSGVLLLPEDDIAEGTPVTSYRPWPTNVGAIVGKPADGRGVGLNAISDDDYGVIAGSTSTMCVFFDVDIVGGLSGNKVWFTGTPSGKWRWSVRSFGTTQLIVRVQNPANAVVAEVVLAQSFQIGDRAQVFASVAWDGANIDVYAKAWGRSIADGTDSTPAANELMGAYLVGRNVVTAESLGGFVELRQIAAWDGVLVTPAEADAIQTAVAAGTPIEEAAPTAPVQVRGISPGWYLADDPTQLLDIVNADTLAPVYAENVASPLPILLPAIQRNALGDEHFRSVGNMPTLPEEGTLIIAVSVDAHSPSGSAVLDLGDTGTGGLRANLVTATTPDRSQGDRGGRLLNAGLAGLLPNEDDATEGAPLFFIVCGWSGSVLNVSSHQNGVKLAEAQAAYSNAIDGVTGLLQWMANTAGRMAWAIAEEQIDPDVAAPLLTSFYSPRNVALSRGTLWYAPGIALTGGRPVTASDVFAVGGSSANVPVEVVAGTAPTRAYPYQSWPGYERVAADAVHGEYGKWARMAEPADFDGRTIFVAIRRTDRPGVPNAFYSDAVAMRDDGNNGSNSRVRFFNFPGGGVIVLTGLHRWEDGILVFQVGIVDDPTDGQVNFRAKDSLGAQFEGGDQCTGALDTTGQQFAWLGHNSRQDWGISGECYAWVVDGAVADSYLDDMPTADFRSIQDYARDRHEAGDTIFYELAGVASIGADGSEAYTDDTLDSSYGEISTELMAGGSTTYEARPPYSVAQYPVRFLTQDTNAAGGGQYIEQDPGVLPRDHPTTVTYLFYGQIDSIPANGALLDGWSSTSGANRGALLRLQNATTLQYLHKDNSGNSDSAAHPISDATSYGPRLYWGVSDASGTLPAGEEQRVGVDDMVADADFQPEANVPGSAGTSDHAYCMGQRSSQNGTDQSITFTKARAIVIARLLTADEWAAAKFGDFSWAEGDPALEFDSAALTTEEGNVDDPAKLRDTSNVITAGSVPPVAVRNELAGA